MKNNKPFCDFVSVNGTWLPNVASVSERSIDIGSEERSINGTLRIAHDGTAREWVVQLAGVPGTDVPALRALLSNPMPSLVNVMGDEVIASVRMPSVAFTPKLRGTVRNPADFGRVNVEVTIREVSVDQVLPGFTYAYQAFLDPGPFEWDWDEAGQPGTGDILRLGGGGGGGRTLNTGGGGAGGLLITLNHPLTGNLTGNVGAGGTDQGNGGDTTVTGLPAALGGGGGASSGGANGSDGGSGAGNYGAGTPGQGNHGGSRGSPYGGGGGGGGSGGPGSAGGGNQHASTYGGRGGDGGPGIDLLALGWNYRLVPGVPRFLGGGGGGSSASPAQSGWASTNGGRGGYGGGGHGGRAPYWSHSSQDLRPGTGGTDAEPRTGAGGGASGDGSFPSGDGAGGLTIVRWRV